MTRNGANKAGEDAEVEAAVARLMLLPGIAGDGQEERERRAREAVRSALRIRRQQPRRRVAVDPSAAYLAADGVAFRQGVVTFTDPGDDYEVAVRVELDGDRIEATEVAVRKLPGGRSLSARGVSEARLGGMMREAVEALAEPESDVAAGEVNARRVEGVAPLVTRLTRVEPKPPGRRPVSRELLETVADAYRQAAAAGQPRRQAVRRALDRAGEPGSLAMAKKRIDQARERGVLEPAGGTTRPPSIPRLSREHPARADVRGGSPMSGHPL